MGAWNDGTDQLYLNRSFPRGGRIRLEEDRVLPDGRRERVRKDLKLLVDFGDGGATDGSYVRVAAREPSEADLARIDRLVDAEPGAPAPAARPPRPAVTGARPARLQ